MLLKGELHQPPITNVINPHKWLMGWQWLRFLQASNTQEQQAIICAKSRLTEKYRLSSMAIRIKPELIAQIWKVV
jgi:hypothetical protein